MRLGFVLMIVALVSLAGCGGSKKAATVNMDNYIHEMGWQKVGGSCAGSDSDGDGYISCTARVRDKDGPEHQEVLECGSGEIGRLTEGCKPKVPTLISTVPVAR